MNPEFLFGEYIPLIQKAAIFYVKKLLHRISQLYSLPDMEPMGLEPMTSRV